MSSRAVPLPELRRAAAPRPPRATPLVQGFVVFLLLCQVSLLLPGIGPVRLVVRVAAFSSSLLMLALVRGRERSWHPAGLLGVLTLLVVCVAIFNPDTSNLVAGSAQAMLYTSVMAPLFWVSRMDLDLKVLRQTVMILWVFHTLSATLGVLQVYFPGSFQPPLSAIILSKGKGYMDSLMITTSNGVRVYRPMGLTDIPGGASISGLYAVLFGTGFYLTRRSAGMMFAAGLSMSLGMTVLYLSQVRAVLVMTGIAVTVVAATLVWRGEIARVWTLTWVAGTVFIGGFAAAMSLAGATVARRMASLTAARPGTVYYNERGHFLADAFNRLLPQAPLGSGLGHWGMTSTYFGRPGDAGHPIWVEIQWAGWIVDGGVPLTGLYVATLVAALLMAWRVARGRVLPSAPDLPFWAAVVLAYGVGAFALTFSYPIFLSQPGMEFWLLNTVLFAAARHARREARRAREAAP